MLLIIILSYSNTLQDITNIAQILGTILLVLYVFYTYRTFVQIKKQTDYQQNAFLRIDHYYQDDLNTKGPPPTSLPLHTSQIHETVSLLNSRHLSEEYLETKITNKIKSALKPIFNFEEQIYEGRYLVLKLTNFGNAEIVRIDLTLTITVMIPRELATSNMLKEQENTTTKIEIKKIVSGKGSNILVPILSTAPLPIFSILIGGKYTDVRDKEYNILPYPVQGQNKQFLIAPELLP